MDTKLTGVPETLLITVRARAEETLRKESLLSDPYAVKIIDSIKTENAKKKKVDAASQIGVVIRTLLFDNVVKDFLTRHPDGTVVCLGCGLDARYQRLKMPCHSWFDVDLNEAIAVRHSFFTEDKNYTMVSKSMLDFEWMNLIDKERPLLVLSEGVFMYFDEAEVKRVVLETFKAFPHAEMVFDTIPPFLVKRTYLHSELKKYDAIFRWGLDKAEDLKRWDSNIDIINVGYCMNYNLERWPLLMRLLRLVPAINRGTKVMHIKYLA